MTDDEELEAERRKFRRLQDVENCARCGGDHGDVTFLRLSRPSGERTHWAPCPTNGEPIMLTIVWGDGQ